VSSALDDLEQAVSNSDNRRKKKIDALHGTEIKGDSADGVC
jgi:hypothetical protein